MLHLPDMKWECHPLNPAFRGNVLPAGNSLLGIKTVLNHHPTCSFYDVLTVNYHLYSTVVSLINNSVTFHTDKNLWNRYSLSVPFHIKDFLVLV
jgi:hypothetical protein